MSVLAVFNLPTNLSYKFKHKHDWHQLDNLLFPILQDDSKKNLHRFGLEPKFSVWMLSVDGPSSSTFRGLNLSWNFSSAVEPSIARVGMSCQTLSHIPSQVAKGFLCPSFLETLKAEGCAAGNLDSKSRNLQFTCGLVLQNNYASVNQIYIYIYRFKKSVKHNQSLSSPFSPWKTYARKNGPPKLPIQARQQYYNGFIKSCCGYDFPDATESGWLRPTSFLASLSRLAGDLSIKYEKQLGLTAKNDPWWHHIKTPSK